VAAPHPAGGLDQLAVVREGEVAAPPALVWAIAGDTNRWDRVVRAGPSSYAAEIVDGEVGRSLVGHGQLAGVPASWLERGEWMEGEFLVGERRYLSGPLSVAGFRLEVSPSAIGTRVRLRAYMTPAQPIPEPLAAAMVANLERAAAAYLDALERMFRGVELAAQQPGEPAASYARRVLLSLAPSALLDEGAGETREEHLAYCAERLDAAAIDPDHRARILDHVRHRGDAELEQVRPFELARAWHTRRRPLLRSFLHAAAAGVFDLRWQINCPRCRVGVAASPRLADVGRRCHCDMCDIDFDTDFAANVEAVFRVNPAIRPIKERVYCLSSPWFRPHVFAVVELAPGEERRLATPAAAERGFVVRTLGPGSGTRIDPGPWRVIAEPGLLHAEPLDRGGLELVNRTGRPCVLMLERAEAGAHVTRGTDILSMPEFLHLYATEAPASRDEIAVGSVAVLFSDLSNTTQMYRALGDARAYSLIRDHFRDMEAIIADAGGAVLKTMGDAVMASFPAPGDAVAAALRMIEWTRAHHGASALHLKVGVHDGPCVMVRANRALDLFGTTVNVAWRLQEQAQADQLVVLETLLGHADVARLLAERGLSATRAEVRLKGLGDGHAVAVITLPPE